MPFFISLPLFLIIFAGWLFRKLKLADNSWVHILNIFAYYVSLPALVIVSLWNLNLTDTNLHRHFVFGLITLFVFSLIVFFVLSIAKIKNSLKSALFLAAITGNTIYMGFPLVEFGFGKNHLPTAAIIGNLYLVIPILTSIFVIYYWHDKHQNNIQNEVFEFAKNPLVISIAIGAVLSFVKTDTQLEQAFQKTLNMLGQTASPLALFLLGSFYTANFKQKI